MVQQSHLNNENVVFLFTPFKFEDYPDKPSSFLIKFVSGGIEYEYSYSLTRQKILNESLYYYPNDRRAKVFTRDETIKGEKKDRYSFGTTIKKPLDVAENTSDKTLYISRASQMDRDLAKDIFSFFMPVVLLSLFSLLIILNFWIWIRSARTRYTSLTRRKMLQQTCILSLTIKISGIPWM